MPRCIFQQLVAILAWTMAVVFICAAHKSGDGAVRSDVELVSSTEDALAWSCERESDSQPALWLERFSEKMLTVLGDNAKLAPMAISRQCRTLFAIRQPRSQRELSSFGQTPLQILYCVWQA